MRPNICELRPKMAKKRAQKAKKTAKKAKKRAKMANRRPIKRYIVKNQWKKHEMCMHACSGAEPIAQNIVFLLDPQKTWEASLRTGG